MNLDSAINHLFLRLQSQVPIRVKRKDKVAFNTIIGYLNVKHEKDFADNLHFANLYAYSLGHFIEKFQTTIDNPLPHKELHKLMDAPFQTIIQDITYKMNMRLMCSALRKAGCNLEKHPALVTEKENEQVLMNLKEQLLILSNNKIFMGNVWSEEEVANGIKSQLKQFLCHTKN